MAELISDIRKRVSQAQNGKMSMAETLSNAPKKASRIIGGIFDRLVWALLCMIYLTFTGIAILLGRKLPKQWIGLLPMMGGDVIRSEISRKMSESTVKQEVKKHKTKIIDIETGKEIV